MADSDFVICSIQDSPAETFKHDLDIPKGYGVYSTVGETVGPGSTFRAMCAIPQYREIARTIHEGCPDAWVINYMNPMTVCTRARYEEYIEGAEDVSRDEIDSIPTLDKYLTPQGTVVETNVHVMGDSVRPIIARTVHPTGP